MERYKTGNSAIDWLIEKSEVILHPDDVIDGIVETSFKGTIPHRMAEEVRSFFGKEKYASFEDNQVGISVSFSQWKSEKNRIKAFKYTDAREWCAKNESETS